MSDFTAEDALILELMMKKRKMATVEAPPQTVCGGAGAAPPPPSFATMASRPPICEPTPRPLFRSEPRLMISGNGHVRPINNTTDYDYLRDWILGGTTPPPGKKRGRGPLAESPNFSQFAIFRGIYDRDPSLFQHISNMHMDTAEPYFSFMYSPGAPHWDIKFHAYGKFEPKPNNPGRNRFAMTRVEWYMGNRGERGVVMYGTPTARDSSSDSASTLTAE